MKRQLSRLSAWLGLVVLVAVPAAPVAAAWEPTKPIELVIPAGTGGGADQMARLIAGIAAKHKLSPQPVIAVNKSGGAGAEGFLHVKGKKGDAYTIIITLSNLFTTPLHTGVPFNWKDLTPIARMALDQFILWVNAETPYKTAKEAIAAVKERADQAERDKKPELRMKMGGTGAAQEDQIITIQVEQAIPGVKFNYVPFKGGGEVCVNLVGKHVDTTVNNPIECVSHWKAGRVRPLAVLPHAPGLLRHARHAQGGRGLVCRLSQEGLRHSGLPGLPEAGGAEAGVRDRCRVREVGRGEREAPS